VPRIQIKSLVVLKTTAKSVRKTPGLKTEGWPLLGFPGEKKLVEPPAAFVIAAFVGLKYPKNAVALPSPFKLRHSRIGVKAWPLD